MIQYETIKFSHIRITFRLSIGVRFRSKSYYGHVIAKGSSTCSSSSSGSDGGGGGGDGGSGECN